MASQDLPRKNIEFLSYSDQGKQGYGVQITVHKGQAIRLYFWKQLKLSSSVG